MNEPQFFSNEEKSNNLDSHTLSLLGEAGKWARFLAILGFISIALMVIAAFFIGTMMSAFFSKISPTAATAFPSMFLTILYLGLAVLYYFPIKYLYDFGSSALAASKTPGNSMQIGSAINSLKKHFKFIAICTIVILSIYALAFIVAIFGALMR